MIGVILLPFALIAALFSLAIVAPILTIIIYVPWFIATHGWTEFKIKYLEDDDAGEGKGG